MESIACPIREKLEQNITQFLRLSIILFCSLHPSSVPLSADNGIQSTQTNREKEICELFSTQPEGMHLYQ